MKNKTDIKVLERSARSRLEKRMRRLGCLTATFFWVFTVSVLGQAADSQSRKNSAYFLVAPGIAVGCSCRMGTLHLGGGGEVFIRGGFGVSADLGYLFPLQAANYGIGVFAPGVLYQFRSRGKMVPFLSGGYTLAFRQGVGNLIHLGGGVNRWLSERLGVRFEGRDHINPRAPQYHLLEVRVSVLLR